MDNSNLLRNKTVINLRKSIIDGRFLPGERLIERHMCEYLEVSRTLVREALRQLETEGWIKIIPNKGPRVVNMTATEIRELYEVRAALEGMAALKAAEMASDDQIRQMVKIVDAMADAQSCGNVTIHRQGVHQFYELLRDAAGNKLLKFQLAAMSEKMAWLRGFTLARPERAAIAVQDERRLVDALVERDGPRARLLCETQLRATGEAVVAAWASHSA